MSRKQKTSLESWGSSLGLEDEDGSPVKGEEIEVAEDGAPIKGDETVEAEELAVDDASDEVSAELDTGDELVEAEQTLESIYAQLSAASESGRGISEDSARFMQIAIEGIVIKGSRLTTSKLGVPSCESFGSSNRALNNTNISMEGVGEAIKKVWEWIKAQIMKVVAKVKTWYKSVLGLAPRLKKRAEAIKKKSEAVSGSSDESTVELSIHKQLVMNKKAEDPAKYVKAIGEVEKALLATTKVGGPMGSKDVDDAIEVLNDMSAESKPANAVGLQLTYTFFTGSKPSDVGVSGGSWDSGKPGDNKEGWTSACMPGNKSLQLVYAKISIVDGDSYKKAMSSIKFGFDGFYKKPGETDSSADYKVLSTDQVGDICDTIIDICEHVEDYDKKWQDREKHGTKLKAALDKAVARLNKDKDADKDHVRQIKSVAMGNYVIWSSGIRTEANIIGYAMGTSRALLTWCERSLSTYK